MAAQVPYWEYKAQDFECDRCGWDGHGASLVQGEMFRELAEFHCPACDRKLALVVFPTRAETRAAAEAGNEEAKEAVDRWADE